MGWASGSELADRIEKALAPLLARMTAEEILSLGEQLAGAFQDMDCDTLQECEGIIGAADMRLDMHRGGAPLRPEAGARFKYWGDWYVFDGTRWQPEES